MLTDVSNPILPSPSHRGLFRTVGVAVLLVLSVGCSPHPCEAPKSVTLIPVTDDNPSTSEYGYAGSDINSVSFIQEGLLTAGDQQFAAFFHRNPRERQDPTNDSLLLARRTLGQSKWEIFKTDFFPEQIDNSHHAVSFAIDGDGYMHLTWGMHVGQLLYAKSESPVTGNNQIKFSSSLSDMTGFEDSVTYPQFYTLPNADLLFLFREGYSGAGDIYIDRYDTSTQMWYPLHLNADGSDHVPLIQGSTSSPDWNAYLNTLSFDSHGNLHMTWTSRYGSDSPANELGYQTNHHLYYAWSPDNGVSWRRQDGSQITLPMTEGEGALSNAAERILSIPEGSSLVNQTGMTVDQSGYPVISTWWAPDADLGVHQRQYMIGFYDGTEWQVRQISNRTSDDPYAKKTEEHVRDLGRPVVVVDKNNRLIVIYRDSEGGNGLTVVYSGSSVEDPSRSNWHTVELTKENLGILEPVHDHSLWTSTGMLSILYQRSNGLGNDFEESNYATAVYVLEWNANDFFACIDDGGATQ